MEVWTSTRCWRLLTWTLYSRKARKCGTGSKASTLEQGAEVKRYLTSRSRSRSVHQGRRQKRSVSADAILRIELIVITLEAALRASSLSPHPRGTSSSQSPTLTQQPRHSIHTRHGPEFALPHTTPHQTKYPHLHPITAATTVYHPKLPPTSTNRAREPSALMHPFSKIEWKI